MKKILILCFAALAAISATAQKNRHQRVDTVYQYNRHKVYFKTDTAEFSGALKINGALLSSGSDTAAINTPLVIDGGSVSITNPVTNLNVLTVDSTAVNIVGETRISTSGRAIIHAAGDSINFTGISHFKNNITADTLKGYHDPGYKVFAANITEPSTLTSGKLVPGVRYTIEDYVEGDDFTNVGSSYDSTGAVFVATGETPNSWLGWSTLAPNDTLIVNVLQNTIGNIEVIHNLYIENEGTIYGTTFYSPDSLFSYNTSVITNEGEFLMNKYFTNARRLSSKYVNMRKMRFYGATLDWDDDRCKATNQYIEIRVYP